MIIYDYRKPVEFENGNCVGVTGENLAYTQEFFIKGMRDTAVNYTIHLRFSDGSVNSVIPDSTVITGDGTRLVWNVKKTDIFVHGYFELQLFGQSDDGMIFQTEIVTLYADESLAVEDKEYANPNTETMQIRDEANRLLLETKEQQKQIEENYELIAQTDLSLKEDSANKVSTKEEISDNASSYPSIEYLNNNYYDMEESYSAEEVDIALDSKPDKADVYTKEESIRLFNFGVTVGFDENYIPITILCHPKVDAYNFQNSEKIKYIFVDAGVKKICSGAFVNCPNMTDIYIANYSENVVIEDGIFVGGIHTINFGQAGYAYEFALRALQYLNNQTEQVITNIADINRELANKVNHKDDVTDAEANYPSVKYLDENYYINKEIDSKIALKYDASNVETGYCTLREPDTAYFNTKRIAYEKIGSFVMLSIQLVASSLIEANTAITLSGLPFVSKMSCSTVTYSNINAEVNLRVATNYNTLTVIPKVNVASGSTITATLTHRIA